MKREDGETEEPQVKILPAATNLQDREALTNFIPYFVNIVVFNLYVRCITLKQINYSTSFFSNRILKEPHSCHNMDPQIVSAAVGIL